MNISITTFASHTPEISTEIGYGLIISLLFVICLCLIVFGVYYKDKYNFLKYNVERVDNQLYLELIKNGVENES